MQYKHFGGTAHFGTDGNFSACGRNLIKCYDHLDADKIYPDVIVLNSKGLLWRSVFAKSENPQGSRCSIVWTLHNSVGPAVIAYRW